MATKVAFRYVSRRFSSGAPRRFSSGARKGQKAGVSTEKNRNYAVVAGVMNGLRAFGWFLPNRFLRETLSMVIELNDKPPGFFCSEVNLRRFGRTRLEFSILKGIGPAGPNENLTENGNANKHSDIFCSLFRVGHDGTTMRWKPLPQGIDPAGPNENLTEKGIEDEKEVEEKAAENIYIKKMEQERLEKLARKGQKAEDTSASSGGADAKASDSTASTSSTAGVSTNKNRNYDGLGALGWYLKSMKVHRLHLETLSMVIELNNNKSSVFFCSEVLVGHDGTIKRYSLLPRGIGPAGPNENLTEIAKKSNLTLLTLRGKRAGVSTDKKSYYAGVVTGLGALVWSFKKKRVVQEILSMVRESNNNTVLELNNKRSGIFCTSVHVGNDGTTMRWKIVRP